MCCWMGICVATTIHACFQFSLFDCLCFIINEVSVYVARFCCSLLQQCYPTLTPITAVAPSVVACAMQQRDTEEEEMHDVYFIPSLSQWQHFSMHYSPSPSHWRRRRPRLCLCCDIGAHCTQTMFGPALILCNHRPTLRYCAVQHDRNINCSVIFHKAFFYFFLSFVLFHFISFNNLILSVVWQIWTGSEKYDNKVQKFVVLN